MEARAVASGGTETARIAMTMGICDLGLGGRDDSTDPAAVDIPSNVADWRPGENVSQR